MLVQNNYWFPIFLIIFYFKVAFHLMVVFHLKDIFHLSPLSRVRPIPGYEPIYRYLVSVRYKRIGMGMKQTPRISFGIGMRDMGDIGIGEII